MTVSPIGPGKTLWRSSRLSSWPGSAALGAAAGLCLWGDRDRAAALRDRIPRTRHLTKKKTAGVYTQIEQIRAARKDRSNGNTLNDHRLRDAQRRTGPGALARGGAADDKGVTEVYSVTGPFDLIAVVRYANMTS